MIGMNVLRLGSYAVPGYDLKVNTAMEIKTADMSGETSSTDQASKGIKPKKLTVSCKIKFSDTDDLSKLYRKAEAKANDGDLVVYTITNRTANAIGVRQVRFSGSVNASEDERLKQWNVSFSLVEYHSVPERVEQREEKAEDVTQTNEGTAVTASTTQETAEPTEEPLTGFEKILSGIDWALS